MRIGTLVSRSLVCLGVGFGALYPAQTATAARPSKAPNITGTYKLVSRDLPDGTKQAPPDVIGLITFSHGYRCLNVYWHDAAGKKFSISYIATYKLTAKEYSEKSVYWMVNDEIGGKGVSYDLTGPAGKAPVTVDGTKISFQFPNYGEPAVVFDGDTFTATRAGAFVDHWEKLK